MIRKMTLEEYQEYLTAGLNGMELNKAYALLTQRICQLNHTLYIEIYKLLEEADALNRATSRVSPPEAPLAPSDPEP